MYITTRTFTATRAVSMQLEYVCALCGAHAQAGLEATATASSKAVYGVGGSADAAARSAHSTAHYAAVRALQEAPCPQCGRYQPQLENRFAAYATAVARLKRRRVPLAALLALVVLAIGIVPAVRDLATSRALLVAVLFASAAALSFGLAIFGWPPARPVPPSATIHFWWGRPDGTVGWVPPPPVPLPFLPPPPSLHGVGLLAGFPCALAFAISLGAYGSTFEDVYVIDASAKAIVVDGIDVTNDVVRVKGTDTSYRKLSVRTGKDHRLELGGTAYDLVKDAPHGWLVAPDASVCFSEEEAIYGHSKDEPGYADLTVANGVVVLAHGYGDVFTEPPKQVRLNKNESVRHVWALRSHPCSEEAADSP